MSSWKRGEGAWKECSPFREAWKRRSPSQFFLGPPPPPSVVGDNGQSTQLAELGLGLPLPLLISQPRLVDLLGQLVEDLVHLCEIDHLGKPEEGE